MNKIRILIISELFFPKNNIGAIRPTKLAYMLAMAGCDVDVFTTQELSAHHWGARYRIVSPSHGVSAEDSSHSVSGRKVKTSQKRGKLLTELAMTRRQLLQYQKSSAFVHCFQNAVTAGKVVLSDYDCIFTTFGPVGSLLVGLRAKKLAPTLKWICDFRDPMVSQIMPKLFVPYYAHLQRKSIRLADHVTTVSNGYKKRIMPQKYMEKCVVIPNGYDEGDRPKAGHITADETFSFAYVGSLYEGKRNLDALFRALREMIDAGFVVQEKVSFHYAGTEFRYLHEQASRYGLETVLRDHGQLPRRECLDLQASVRFLVMATWNDRGEEGVFPGKLIEYMLLQKPVVNIVGGRLPESEVTQVIRQLNLGISCEEAVTDTYSDLVVWLREQCEAFRTGCGAVFSPRKEEIAAQYDWRNIVKRFGDLIDG